MFGGLCFRFCCDVMVLMFLGWFLGGVLGLWDCFGFFMMICILFVI